MAAKKLAIGIDLGTTYSCVAVFRNGRVDVIANDQGYRITPSCVAFTDEEKLVGDAAKEQATVNHLNTIYEIKRLIGCKYNEKSVQKDMSNWPFKVVDVGGVPKMKVTYKHREKILTSEEISAMVLTEMKKIAEVYLGCSVTDAVITVPAYFNDSQRQATKDAGRIAGLNVLSIINEPTAAAIAYGIDKRVTVARNVLVFDLGGGTFDVVILNITNGNFEVKAVGGDTHLGGSDFDNRMVKHFSDVIKNKFGIDISSNMRASARLKAACEKAKRSLSSTLKTTVAIDGLIDGEDFTSPLTRNRFEDLCSDLFQKTLEHVKTVIEDAGITKGDIGEVVLVGGSTRIPKVKQLLQTFFAGKTLNQTINPDEAVASGAAIKAALSCGERQIRDISLKDVIPLSLGLENVDGRMVTSIKRNTSVPINHISEWTTPHDFMSKAMFRVFEGENQIAEDNHLLGEFTLNDIEIAPRGVAKFAVNFKVDSDGILQVSARDKKTQSKNNIIITSNKGRLSNTDISRMMQEVKLYDNTPVKTNAGRGQKASQAQQRQKASKTRQGQNASQAREVLESFCFSQKMMLNSRSVHDALSNNDRKKALDLLDDTLCWIDENGNLGEQDYKRKMQSTRDKCAPHIAKLHA